MVSDKKVFSKEKWLESANEQIKQGTLTQRERDDALGTWVNQLDGKTMTEIYNEFGENAVTRADWFVDVE